MNSMPESCEPAPRRGRRLWIFAPGLEAVARASAERFTALERLVARGRRVQEGRDAWAMLAALAGGDTGRWPVGPVSLLGDGGEPPAGCLRIEPLGMDGEGAFRIPGSRLGLTGAEADALARRFGEVLGEDGIRMSVAAPGRWYLEGGPGWAGAAGPPPAPLAAGEPALLKLVSEIEMLFFDHPVNRAREAAGAPRIAGVHPWGGGRLPGGGPRRMPPGWGGEPYLAGLWRLAGARPAAGPGELLEAGGVAWPVAAEEAGDAMLERLETRIGVEALGALSRGRLREVRLVTTNAVFVTTRLGARLPWRRPRPLGECL